MASFSKGLGRVGNWNGYAINGTLNGNVARSGNTVTLSGMTLTITATASAWGYDTFTFTVNGTATSATIGNTSGGQWSTTSMGLNNTSFGVSASQTSANVGWRSSDGDSGSFNITFPSGAYTFKATGTGVTFDVSLGGTSVASDTSSYTNSNVNPNTAWVVSDIKAVVGKYYTGLTTEEIEGL